MKRIVPLAFAASLLAAPAFAQTGNSTNPNRAVPNTGTTSGGPADTMASPGTAGSGVVVPAPMTGAPDSAAASNANQQAKPTQNTGAVSGGPAKAAGQ
jgi:hypothetical protein